MTLKMLWPILRDTCNGWSEDNTSQAGAALAYYTMFSLAPLLVIAIAIGGLVFGHDAARGQVQQHLQGVVGATAATAIEEMVKKTSASTGSGVLATVIGVVVLLFGALGVFSELQQALNAIWKVEPKPGRGWHAMLRDRALSFAMVLGIGLLLLVSLAVSTVLSALGKFLAPGAIPGGAFLWQVVNGLVSFGFFILLFAMIYKLLPDVKIRWKDVLIGAVVTALLFAIGKFLIGLYLGRASVTSAYGAAGSLVLILLWVYYSSQVFLFGAEFTRVYAQCCGTPIEPADNAVFVRKEILRRADAPAADNGKAGSSSPHEAMQP